MKNRLDRATDSMPELLRELSEEMGIDFTVLYPTLGPNFPHMDNEELRRSCCRASNAFHAAIFGEYAVRMTLAAGISMHTPQEAIDDLECETNMLGLEAVVMARHVHGPIPVVSKAAPQAAQKGNWLDTFCLDSEYDYDPVSLCPACPPPSMAPCGHTCSSMICPEH